LTPRRQAASFDSRRWVSFILAPTTFPKQPFSFCLPFFPPKRMVAPRTSGFSVVFFAPCDLSMSTCDRDQPSEISHGVARFINWKSLHFSISKTKPTRGLPSSPLPGWGKKFSSKLIPPSLERVTYDRSLLGFEDRGPRFFSDLFTTDLDTSFSSQPKWKTPPHFFQLFPT